MIRGQGRWQKLWIVVSTAGVVMASQGKAAEPITTIAERSGFQQTGRYDEVIALCDEFVAAYPDAVRKLEFGRTPEGRPMLALVATRSGALTPAKASQQSVPVVLIQGGIHSGEIDGKDAGFLALRELLEREMAPDTLDKVALLFVPVFNIDGHERFGRWNRPNQRGPEEMGWRTTAQNLNLNRDYLKADAPEMQAMLRLVNDWDPIAVIDCHVTDGAKFEHDVSVEVEPCHCGDTALAKAGQQFRDAVIARLAKQGSLPLPFYPSLATRDDPQSGFVDGVSPPRFSHGYFPLRNRFGMLLETHSWKDYPTRVRITRNTIVAVLEQAAANGEKWLALARAADERASHLGGEIVPLTYEATEKSHEIEFRGYAYTRTRSEISGALMTRYDESRPEIWRVPLRGDVQPAVVATAPRGGYIVPAAYAAAVAAKLDVHGLSYRVLGGAVSSADVESFRAESVQFSPQPVEGRQTLVVGGQWRPDHREILQGSLYVPISQAKARLVIAMFEPLAPDSLLSWGMFNAAFERKEYMEAYVAEDVAREQLASDDELAEDFRQRVDEDPEFAANPSTRLDFFYQRHPSWDERFNLYPVLRTEESLK
jgi:hypothetical protein